METNKNILFLFEYTEVEEVNHEPLFFILNRKSWGPTHSLKFYVLYLLKYLKNKNLFQEKNDLIICASHSQVGN